MLIYVLVNLRMDGEFEEIELLRGSFSKNRPLKKNFELFHIFYYFFGYCKLENA
jgi:hypothetical protein